MDAVGNEVKAPRSSEDGSVSEAPPQSPDQRTTEHRTPECLIAKAIAPVKLEFLRPPPPRTALDAEAEYNVEDNATEKRAAPSAVIREKKSKRQLKRERKQACANEVFFSSNPV
ncbi:hypothetical protein HPP92_014973 [Vanilla planifolia]|uniref:Uncharacterized protein n=1 Tax=Vanilla planifolia TaxID=51239 RepID=A0A835QLF1_VANPL|nr:hypothetical protein HPP92_014973 [Vanilla planifolia]